MSTAGLPARRDTQRLAAIAARNKPSRVPLSTSTSLSGSTGAREFVAAVEPGRDRVAERLDAFVGRIAAEVGEMRGQHRADEGRHRMLRLADRQIDDRLARLDAGNELGQAHEGRAAVSAAAAVGAAAADRSVARGAVMIGGIPDLRHWHTGGEVGAQSTPDTGSRHRDRAGKARGTRVKHNRRGEVKTRLTITGFRDCSAS